MDNQNKKTPRKVHDINTQIEEENLWDLDDDWDDAGDEDANNESQQEIPSAAPQEVKDVVGDTTPEAQTEKANEPEDDSEDVQLEAQTQSQPEAPVEKAPLGNDDEFDFEEEDLDENLLQEPIETSEPVKADESYEEFENLPEQDGPEPLEEALDTQATESGEEPDQVPSPQPTEANETTGETETNTPSNSEPETHANPLKKLSLSITEKIALSTVAAILIGLLIYSYAWLKGKNNESTEVKLELPVKGEYAYVTGFSTFWKTPGDSPGIKLGATVVPAASIDLGEESSSGALRVFFRNANDERIGDTITLSFTNGKFANGSNTIEVSASDGFHLKGDFHAYQMDSSLAWKVYVLEAASNSAKGSDYKELLETRVEAIMR